MIGFDVLPNEKYSARRVCCAFGIGHREMNLRLIQLLSLMMLALLLTPEKSFAGCNVQTFTPAGLGPNMFVVLGSCSTSADAQASCGSFAASHYYDPATFCNSAYLVWGAGLLCDLGETHGYCNGVPPGGGDPNYKMFAGDFHYPIYYLSIDTPRLDCDRCNTVHDPIQPSNGATSTSAIDISESNPIVFSHYYNSLNSTGSAWRYSYSRSVTPLYNGALYQPYQTGNSNYSPYYMDASTACTTGFTLIRTKVANWSSATASYQNGICTLSDGGANIGAITIKYSLSYPGSDTMDADTKARLLAMRLPPETSSLIGFDVTRDDGQVIRFSVINGVITAPPTISLRLQQTASDVTLTDANDNVEAYDTNGKLLSITSRTGIVQTMSYDGAGRLNQVIDSYGYKLILTYDVQDRLSTVARP